MINKYRQLHIQLTSVIEPFILANIDLFNNKVIFDIGSNIGVFSELICKNIMNYESIHLFEPCVEYFEFSKKLLSSFSNLHFNNYALGSMDEIKTIFKFPEPSGWNTFLKVDPNQEENFFDKMLQEECLVSRLDNYKVSKCDFIKIDVEGFESYVLEGGMEFIKIHRPLIYIEVAWGSSHPEWNFRNKAIYQRLFKEANYHVMNFDDKTQDILFHPICE